MTPDDNGPDWVEAGGAPSEPPGQPWRRSLSYRLAVLLTLALLPMGLIAVAQTLRLQNELDEIARRDRLVRLTDFAEAERDELDSARAASGTLAAVLPEVLHEPNACAALMRRFINGSGSHFVYAGFTPLTNRRLSAQPATGDGIATGQDGPLAQAEEEPFFCASDERNPPTVGTGRGMLTIRRLSSDDDAKRAADTVVSAPVWSLTDEGAPTGLAGTVTVIVSQVTELTAPEVTPGDGAGGALMLFSVNTQGRILTPPKPGSVTPDMGIPPEDVRMALIEQFHPNQPDVGLDSRSVQVMEYGNVAMAALPILSGAAYAVAVWQLDAPAIWQAASLSATLFPLLMWLLSLGLMYWAVHRQIVRPVSILGAQMRRFGRIRELPAAAPEGSLPHELEEIENEFQALADTLIRDEAGLMDALHDKDVLLKEVHHRVKNNLQLISSIINMQTRRTHDPKVAVALASINRRVAGMSTVHQRLYQAAELGRVRADDMLRDVIGPLVSLAPGGRAAQPDVEMDLAPVILYPDQALPVALLAVEAVTNALKYFGADSSGRRWLKVELIETTTEAGEMLKLSITNSMRPDGISEVDEETQAMSTGLGSQLITAFARQLESDAQVTEGAGFYSVSAEFPLQPFDPGA
ncbi:sensor histidine kinase [Chachezhania sediminis]|uniref:sensor histidine kinase n=1 Tax=Chachezhania sediminis TaxID=2599291 RepID=UPI00131D3010|nr:sensor histidine kinase [Chachezhania sediminis]